MRTGMLGEFRTPEEMLDAIRALRQKGYRRLDAFSPFPIKGAEKALELPRSRINWILGPIGIGAAGFGFLVQWYCNAFDYPINVGGRPLNSAPTSIPLTFETGVLVTGIMGVFLLLVLSGLPSLYSPLADVDGFERASIDTFWVGIDDRDPQFDEDALRVMLGELGAVTVARARERRTP